MIGRGAVTTPDLTLRIRKNKDDAILSWQDLVELQQRFLNGKFKTEIGMIGRYKQWLGMMSKAYPEAQELWHQVKRIKQLDQIIECLHTIYSEKS
jgi:tRNA-dihydrouridine synthase C